MCPSINKQILSRLDAGTIAKTNCGAMKDQNLFGRRSTARVYLYKGGTWDGGGGQRHLSWAKEILTAGSAIG